MPNLPIPYVSVMSLAASCRSADCVITKILIQPEGLFNRKGRCASGILVTAHAQSTSSVGVKVRYVTDT